MKMIKWAVCIMEGNVEEARKYISEAYDMRDTDRPTADWCREMAAYHLSFNEKGQALIKRWMDEKKAVKENAEYTAGMLAVWQDRCTDITHDTAKVRAMIDTFK